MSADSPFVGMNAEEAARAERQIITCWSNIGLPPLRAAQSFSSRKWISSTPIRGASRNCASWQMTPNKPRMPRKNGTSKGSSTLTRCKSANARERARSHKIAPETAMVTATSRCAGTPCVYDFTYDILRARILARLTHECDGKRTYRVAPTGRTLRFGAGAPPCYS